MVGETATGRCIVCGSSERSPLYRWDRGFEVWRCGECGLLYTDPLPDEDQLAEHYRDLSRIEAEPGHMRRRDQIEARLAAVREAVSRYLTLVAEIRGTGRIGRILDAGGGLGLYSKAAESLGCEAHLLEIDDQSVEFARRELDLEHVIQGDVRDLAALVQGTFDVVLCRHVIEHVRDPASLVQDLAEVLAPSGVLILETPNADNREQWAHPGIVPVHWRMLGRANPDLSRSRRLAMALRKPLSVATPPKHLYGFRAENLELLMRRYGLAPRKRVITVCGDRVFDPLYYRAPAGGPRVLRGAYRLYERPASRLVQLAGKGSRLAVFAEKPRGAERASA